MSEYVKDTEGYLASVFETYLELRTDSDFVDFEDLSDFKAFLEEGDVEYDEELDLSYPPTDSEELGELVRFVSGTEVIVE